MPSKVILTMISLRNLGSVLKAQKAIYQRQEGNCYQKYLSWILKGLSNKIIVPPATTGVPIPPTEVLPYKQGS